MKSNIATTQDQSARLLRCGVSADTADMCYDSGALSLMDYDSAVHERDSRRESYEVIPAWSLSRLLSLLPTSIMSPLGNEYMLELSKLRMHDAWEVQWFSGRDRFRTYDKKKNFHKLWDKSPIEACVKAIEWVTSNGYKLNEQ
jgi:hypothetical protein